MTIAIQKSGDSDIDQTELALVPGRTCGACSLCCKVYSIAELNKPAGQWCPHLARGPGCTIYKSRPQDCRQFFCAWLLDPTYFPHVEGSISG
jgi:hypothetical protein